MAKGESSIDKLKDLWNSQVNDEQQWALNFDLDMRKLSLLAKERNLLKATGLFAGAIFFMRNFGELMSI